MATFRPDVLFVSAAVHVDFLRRPTCGVRVIHSLRFVQILRCAHKGRTCLPFRKKYRLNSRLLLRNNGPPSCHDQIKTTYSLQAYPIDGSSARSAHHDEIKTTYLLQAYSVDGSTALTTDRWRGDWWREACEPKLRRRYLRSSLSDRQHEHTVKHI